MDHILFFLPLFILLSLQCTKTIAQAPALAPSGPTNITKILEKASQFTTFIQLFQINQVGDQINTQLNNSNQGMTVFAPTDNAFSSLKVGTINSLSDQQKMVLVQFHILPTFFSMSQFQTASNPLRTQAGNNDDGEFPLNVTTSGNQVNVFTGVDNTTVSNTIYTDGQLAVYQVDKVLLPLSIFASPSPAHAPVAGGKPKKSGVDDSSVAGEDDTPADFSGAVGVGVHGIVAFGIAMLAKMYLW